MRQEFGLSLWGKWTRKGRGKVVGEMAKKECARGFEQISENIEN
mgnify:CR=1 FL=1